MAKRLLFVVNDAGFFITHRLPLAVAMRNRGHEVAVACPADNKVAQLEAEQLIHLDVPLARRETGPLGELRALWVLRRQIHQFSPDLVHLITAKPIIYGGLLTRWQKIPTVAAFSGLGHVFSDDGLSARVLRAVVLAGYRMALNRPGVFAIFQNGENRDLLQNHKALREQSTMIRGSGTDLQRFDPSPAANPIPVVVLPARMLFSKGVADFVEAARILQRQDIAARFILIGAPDASNPASVPQAQLQAWHDEGIVEWQGYRADIEAALQESDLVVLPSFYGEGLPKSLVDAAAAGRAVVTSDVAGCRDAIVHGETGLLARPQDTADLAARIKELLTDPERRLAMGRAGRKLAETDFAIEHIVADHLALYDRALSQAQAAKSAS